MSKSLTDKMPPLASFLNLNWGRSRRVCGRHLDSIISSQTHPTCRLPRDERLRPMAPRKEDTPNLVSDYIDHTSASRRTDKVDEFFWPMGAEVIKGIPLCTRNQQDFWACH
jgi:hypothetical protein